MSIRHAKKILFFSPGVFGETKKPAETPKTASVSPAKKASGTYTAESGRSTKKWFYNIAGVTLVFGLIVYFIWDYREKEIKKNAFESVKTALENENYDIIDSAENLIEDYPEEGRGYEYLATAYYGKGEYEKALEVLDDGREQAEDSDCLCPAPPAGCSAVHVPLPHPAGGPVCVWKNRQGSKAAPAVL